MGGVYWERTRVKFKMGKKSFKRTTALLITPSTPREVAIRLWAEESNVFYDDFEVISAEIVTDEEENDA